jgi:hypothetical protein
MEAQPPFNLDEALAGWKQQLMATGRFSQDNLEELTGHLLDETEVLQATGLAQDEAFYIALRRIGQVDELKVEFAKVNGRYLYHSRLMLLLNGVVLFLLIKLGAELGNMLLSLVGRQLQWSESSLLYMDWGIKAGIFLLVLSLLLLVLRGNVKGSWLLQHVLYPKPLLVAALVSLVVLSQLGVWFIAPMVRHEISGIFLLELRKSTVFFSAYIFVAVAAALLYVSVKIRKQTPAVA